MPGIGSDGQIPPSRRERIFIYVWGGLTILAVIICVILDALGVI